MRLFQCWLEKQHSVGDPTFFPQLVLKSFWEQKRGGQINSCRLGPQNIPPPPLPLCTCFVAEQGGWREWDIQSAMQVKSSILYSLHTIGPAATPTMLLIKVSETGSAKTGSAIDVRIDDAGSTLKFHITFSPWFSAMASQLRPSLVVGFGEIEAIDAECPYRVPIVDRGGDCFTPVCRPHFRFLERIPDNSVLGQVKHSLGPDGTSLLLHGDDQEDPPKGYNNNFCLHLWELWMPHFN